jgi:hypothetical protein
MNTRRRALAGAASGAPAPGQNSGLTFPARLLHPPQSQVAHSEDAVSNRVVQLDVWAQRLGEAFGIPFTTFALNPLPTDFGGDAVAGALAALASLAHRLERVSLERRSGKWGLYFTREPALLAHERRADALSLKDASLDVRERFLCKSEEFFRQYLQVCGDRLGSMKSSVSHADRTLELLGNIRLE